MQFSYSLAISSFYIIILNFEWMSECLIHQTEEWSISQVKKKECGSNIIKNVKLTIKVIVNKPNQSKFNAVN